MLVAIDGSEASFHALKESFKLVTSGKSRITAICMTPPYEGDIDLLGIGDAQSALRRPCEEAIAKAEKLAGDEKMDVRFVHETGTPYKQIIDAANKYDCELIVMGRRGLHKFERKLIGSVSTRVIGYSNLDVLIIPMEASVGWNNILVATDGSKHSEKAVERAIDFAAECGGTLNVVSVVDVPRELHGETLQISDKLLKKVNQIIESATEKAARAGVTVKGHVKTGHSTEAILELADELSIDTIFVGSHGRTGLTRLLMGSVSEKIVGLSRCPVIIVK